MDFEDTWRETVVVGPMNGAICQAYAWPSLRKLPMSDTFVLVHGAWHTGADFDVLAHQLRNQGHRVHCPTLRGNRAEDAGKETSLAAAIESLVDYIEHHCLDQVRLVGHSYGGMVVSGAASRLLPRLSRLVYINAFVPLDGESVMDMVCADQSALMQVLAEAGNGQVLVPFPIWRELFMNDATLAQAAASYESLVPQPYGTLVDKIALSSPLAQLGIGKSYINCRQDTAMPHSLPWHPRLSERLGLFRYVESSGGHEALLTQPVALAESLLVAARD